MRLTSTASANTKLRKSESSAYRVIGLALAPADSSGVLDVCPQSSEGCRAACVGSSRVGLAAVFSAIGEARAKKTRLLKEHPAAFIDILCDEIASEEHLAAAEGRKLAVRLNTFSDILWESKKYGIPQRFPAVQFYDYTKIPARLDRVPDNYALCLSWSEEPRQQASCLAALEAGHNVSVVFYEDGSFTGSHALRQRLPARWNGFRVHDGDTTDLRFLDPSARTGRPGYVIGLRLKSASLEHRDEVIRSGFPVLVK